MGVRHLGAAALWVAVMGCSTADLAPEPLAEAQQATLAWRDENGACHSNGELFLHDPHAIRVVENGQPAWYVFSTAQGIAIRRSVDLVSFSYVGRVFPPSFDAACNDANAIPAWARAKYPAGQAPLQIWSPTVTFFGGRYHVYYAISNFGSSTTYLGHASVASLGDGSAWVDHGQVMTSGAVNGAHFTTDGPDVIQYVNGNGVLTARLTFGGFFSGVYQKALSLSTGLPSGTPVKVAARNNERYHALEGAHVFQRGEWFYLVANWDYCCGRREPHSNLGWTKVYPPYVRSTSTAVNDYPAYRLVVGRSRSPAGPFVDAGGVGLNAGGGTLLLQSSGNLVGPGGASIVTAPDGSDVMIVHRYAERDVGLGPGCLPSQDPQVRRIRWVNGWPTDDGPYHVAPGSDPATGTNDDVAACLPASVVAHAGTGGHVVTPCGSERCRFDSGQTVVLDAVADPGYRFSSWSGDCPTSYWSTSTSVVAECERGPGDTFAAPNMVCEKTCTASFEQVAACIPPPETTCPAYTAPAAGACPPACTGGCAGGVCTIDCSTTSACQVATRQCPDGMECSILCAGVSACQGSTLRCPNDAACTVACTNTSTCQGAAIVCPPSAPCDVQCSGSSSCQSGDVICGAGPCHASCTGSASGLDRVECGASCSCSCTDC